MKPLWVRALANRSYWDRYQLAQDGFRAQAKLRAQLEFKKRGDQERHQKYVAIVATTSTATPATNCPNCGMPRELRTGNLQPTHLGPPCARAIWRTPNVPVVIDRVARCSARVFFRNKNRPCSNPAGRDGVCTFHRLKKAIQGG